MVPLSVTKSAEKEVKEKKTRKKVAKKTKKAKRTKRVKKAKKAKKTAKAKKNKPLPLPGAGDIEFVDAPADSGEISFVDEEQRIEKIKKHPVLRKKIKNNEEVG